MAECGERRPDGRRKTIATPLAVTRTPIRSTTGGNWRAPSSAATTSAKFFDLHDGVFARLLHSEDDLEVSATATPVVAGGAAGTVRPRPASSSASSRGFFDYCHGCSRASRLSPAPIRAAHRHPPGPPTETARISDPFRNRIPTCTQFSAAGAPARTYSARVPVAPAAYRPTRWSASPTPARGGWKPRCALCAAANALAGAHPLAGIPADRTGLRWWTLITASRKGTFRGADPQAAVPAESRGSWLHQCPEDQDDAPLPAAAGLDWIGTVHRHPRRRTGASLRSGRAAIQRIHPRNHVHAAGEDQRDRCRDINPPSAGDLRPGRFLTVNGRTLEGNCDLCFLKPAASAWHLIKARPRPRCGGYAWSR